MIPEPGLVVGGKFRLERPLASGGMGAVWAARHIGLDAPVAVKFIGESLMAAPGARTRFEREAKAAAQLRSPHVVQILDYGIEGSMPYIAMELLDGEDLQARLARRHRLPLAEISMIVGQVAKALKLAHDAGIVHRDLKPSNLFLARVGDEEIVKVLDFGVAKQTRIPAGDDATTTGLLLGSPNYMSPEQARGGVVDPRTDVWSLGVIAFHALTGHRPFKGDHPGDVLVKICTDELPSATEVVPALPKAIDAFFSRALCRSPDGRFGSARELADALAAIAGAGDIAREPPDASMSDDPRAGIAPRDDETASIALESRFETPPRRPQRRVVGLFIGLVAVSTAIWFASRSRFERPPPAAPATAAEADAAPERADATSGIDEGIPVRLSDPTPTAHADAPEPAPATSAARAPARAPARRTPSARGASSSTPQLDPKFGLPVSAP